MVADPASYPLILRFGDLRIDLERYRVLLNGQPLALAYRDYALLVYLAGRAGQIVSRRQLLEEGLGRHDPGGLRTVDERIRHLKQLLERDQRTLIHEVEGQGYRFARPDELEEQAGAVAVEPKPRHGQAEDVTRM